MIILKRTNADHEDFKALVNLLDADLAIRDGEEHAFYDQFNKIGSIRFVVLAYEENRALGCGAIKELNGDTVEVKRMYVSPGSRKMGIASKILSELEAWARELSFTKCILETGKRQPEAVELYKRNGYLPIPNYGPYARMENSLCFEKKLE